MSVLRVLTVERGCQSCSLGCAARMEPGKLRQKPHTQLFPAPFCPCQPPTVPLALQHPPRHLWIYIIQRGVMFGDVIFIWNNEERKLSNESLNKREWVLSTELGLVWWRCEWGVAFTANSGGVFPEVLYAWCCMCVSKVNKMGCISCFLMSEFCHYWCGGFTNKSRRFQGACSI